MWTIIKILTLVLVCALPGLMHSEWARAADEVIDQEQTRPCTDVWKIGGGYRPEMAQIVTAAWHGVTYRVGLYLENVSATGSVLVSIQTVIGGKPSGIEIGRGKIPVDSLPPYGEPDWVNVIIGNVPVVPGTQYAIVLSSANGTIQWYACGDVYPRGFMLANDGNGWISWPVADAMFRTWVIPDQLDQSQGSEGPSNTYYNGVQVGQTFTAGLSGFLDRVLVFLQNATVTQPCIDPIQVTIQTVTEEGYPSGKVIGYGSIPCSSLPTVRPGPVTASIIGASVSAGTQYALVLKQPRGGGAFMWPMWPDYDGNSSYPGGTMVYNDGGGWYGAVPLDGAGDAVFETFVAQPIMFSPPPSPPLASTTCSGGVCPVATATITPADSTAQITSNVQFRARQNGTVQGILSFNDSRTGDVALHGCTTDSTACRLTVTTFACTDDHAITIKGTYTPRGETETYYELNLSGVKKEIGTFTLTVGNDTYTLTRDGIVDVTCPPWAGISVSPFSGSIRSH
jgi:hypothetical protein